MSTRATTFGALPVGATFRFRGDPLRERCTKTGETSYVGPMSGSYDARRVASGISSLTASTRVVSVKGIIPGATGARED